MAQCNWVPCLATFSKAVSESRALERIKVEQGILLIDKDHLGSHFHNLGGVKLRSNKTLATDGRRNSVARRRMEREAEERRRAEAEEAERMVRSKCDELGCKKHSSLYLLREIVPCLLYLQKREAELEKERAERERKEREARAAEEKVCVRCVM